MLGFCSVCLLLITGSFYHPRLLSDEVESEEVQLRMKEQEEHYKRLLKEVEEKCNLDNNAKVDTYAEAEDSAKVNWQIYLIVTILFVALWRGDTWSHIPLEYNSEEEEEGEKENEFPQRIYSNNLNIPDKSVLNQFHNISIQNVSQEPMQTCEFVESFVDNLLEACRNLCQWDTGLILEDCVGIGSQFEKWGCKMPPVYDILVPIFLQDGYCFKLEFDCCDIPPDKQSYGRILMVTPNSTDLGCQCTTTELEGDVLCLVHNKRFEDVHSLCLASSMCSKWYLDYEKVVKWFRLAFDKSWNKICHKYDFELAFHKITGCCGLKIQHQSGRTVHIKVFPAVRLKDSDVYLVSSFSNCSKKTTLSTIYWHISCAVCEYRFLKIMAKNVPKSSCHLKCLQILIFLTEKLCSSSDQPYVLGSYLFKTVLMHLLLSQPYSNWHECNLEHRLRDVLKYLGKCLDEKRLHRFMIGNQIFPQQIEIPEMLLQSEPINLFRSFAIERDSYSQALMEYQKILREMGPLMMECTKSNTVS
ncbi:inositol 1,4,5-trisphosphate receptor-interacting protein-like [Narcine bancroftii]|uniref:inositol 1,4,5-trisphosphate receptor-interacting protein-like n=1 Tax=Narcine bancroftii TaxID=1343680 RepID=UPI0038316ADF